MRAGTGQPRVASVDRAPARGARGWTAGRAPGRRGVHARRKGYDPPDLPACPAVLRVSATDEIVHGVPGSRALADGDAVSLDFGVEFDGSLAVHCEHGILLAQDGSETLTPVRGSCGSVGEIGT